MIGILTRKVKREREVMRAVIPSDATASHQSVSCQWGTARKLAARVYTSALLAAHNSTIRRFPTAAFPVTLVVKGHGDGMDSKQFGQTLKKLRERRGYTQRQLAERLFVTDKAVSKWECGLGFPDVKLLTPLAEALGVGLTELMSAPLPAISLASPDDDAPPTAAVPHGSHAIRPQTSARLHITRPQRAWLMIPIVICLLMNLYFGYVFDWLMGNRITFAQAYAVLYILRYLFAAAALIPLACLCLWPKQKGGLIALSLIGCLLSVLATPAVSVCWRLLTPMAAFARLDLSVLLLLALSAALISTAIWRVRQGCMRAACALLCVSAACTLGPMLLTLSMHTQPPKPLWSVLMMSIALSSPMALAAAYIRFLASIGVTPDERAAP